MVVVPGCGASTASTTRYEPLQRDEVRNRNPGLPGRDPGAHMQHFSHDALSLDTVLGSGSEPRKEEKILHSEGSASVLSFTTTNDYPQTTWSPWEHIAEPYRETVLTADSTAGDIENDIFVWTLPSDNGAVYEGR